jgi:hypothetical protein
MHHIDFLWHHARVVRCAVLVHAVLKLLGFINISIIRSATVSVCWIPMALRSAPISPCLPSGPPGASCIPRVPSDPSGVSLDPPVCPPVPLVSLGSSYSSIVIV